MRASRRPVATLVALGHLFASTLLALPPNAFAQTGEAGDTDPPLIEFEPVERGVRGDTQVVSAGITDDVAVDSATLHYRLDADAPYRSLAMEPLRGTSIYSASVETADTGAEVLQYYVEARDAAGNRSIRGFAFDPLERALVEGDAPAVAAESAAAPEPGLSTRQKVLYGVLGVIAVGAIAAAAGGSSGGGDPARGDDPGGAGDGPGTGIPVNITVEVP